jgi:hypothetical protein
MLCQLFLINEGIINYHIHELAQTWLVCTAGVGVALEVSSCQSNIETLPNILDDFIFFSILCSYSCNIN